MSCTEIPTSTLYTTVTTQSSSVSSSQSVQTVQPSVTTIVSSACAATGSGALSLCLSSTPVTSTSTISSGGVKTVDVPVTVTVPVTTVQPTATLFSTSCASSQTSSTTSTSTSSTSSTTTSTSTTSSSTHSSSTSSSTSTSTSTSTTSTTPFTTDAAGKATGSSTTSFIASTTTPPPTTFTTLSSSTLGDGSIVYLTVTGTSTLPASVIYVPTTLPVMQNGNSTSNDNSSHLGPVIGGAIGGVIGLVAIISALWFFLRRKPDFDDFFEKDLAIPADDDQPRQRRSRRVDLLEETEPKPYQYGLVGHVPPPPSSHSHGHSHTPSEIYLSAPPSSHGHTRATSPSISRASTAGSTQPLMNLGARGQSTSPPPIDRRKPEPLIFDLEEGPEHARRETEGDGSPTSLRHHIGLHLVNPGSPTASVRSSMSARKVSPDGAERL